jgi:hypothetical protein
MREERERHEKVHHELETSCITRARRASIREEVLPPPALLCFALFCFTCFSFALFAFTILSPISYLSSLSSIFSISSTFPQSFFCLFSLSCVYLCHKVLAHQGHTAGVELFVQTEQRDQHHHARQDSVQSALSPTVPSSNLESDSTDSTGKVKEELQTAATAAAAAAEGAAEADSTKPGRNTHDWASIMYR